METVGGTRLDNCDIRTVAPNSHVTKFSMFSFLLYLYLAPLSLSPPPPTDLLVIYWELINGKEREGKRRKEPLADLLFLSLLSLSFSFSFSFPSSLPPLLSLLPSSSSSSSPQTINSVGSYITPSSSYLPLSLPSLSSLVPLYLPVSPSFSSHGFVLKLFLLLIIVIIFQLHLLIQLFVS